MTAKPILSRRMSQPIRRMTRAVDGYAGGERMMTGLPVERGDEIGLLARAFRSMAAQVDEARHSLSEANARLESTVEKRTRALQRSELRQRIVVENMVDGLITINEQGLIQDFNRAAETLFGYGAEEVTGRSVSMLMPEPYASAHDGYIRAYQEGGEAKIIGIGREVEGRHQPAVQPARAGCHARTAGAWLRVVRADLLCYSAARCVSRSVCSRASR